MSSGGAVSAALKIAQEAPGRVVVCIVCDRGARGEGRDGLVSLWMAEIHFAPKKPWDADSPVNTNKQRFQPWFQTGAKWISSIHNTPEQPEAPSRVAELLGMDAKSTSHEMKPRLKPQFVDLFRIHSTAK